MNDKTPTEKPASLNEKTNDILEQLVASSPGLEVNAMSMETATDLTRKWGSTIIRALKDRIAIETALVEFIESIEDGPITKDQSKELKALSRKVNQRDGAIRAYIKLYVSSVPVQGR